jgi:predicted lipid-binding transport protein (Tim44 family)
MSSLKENSTATVDELRQFLDSMRGKSAKEELGKLAESGLIKAVVQATVISVVAIAIFTVGPYFLQDKKGAAGAAAAKSADGKTADAKSGDAPAAGGQNANASAAAPAATGATGANPATAGADGESSAGGPGSDIERAAKMMGVSDTKAADPKSNPRERDLDNLLDKIK